MDALEAERIIESLRQGVPPEGHVADFTVGRQEEIDKLQNLIRRGRVGALLIKANYGSGKTHLLKLIREMALAKGYAVSLVTLDSQSAVRFNRMDQIFGQICRRIEVPSNIGHRGVRYLFETFYKAEKRYKTNPETLWAEISNYENWDGRSCLKSDIIYVALRAFGPCFREWPKYCDEIEDWLFTASHHVWQPADVYEKFIRLLRPYFRDSRSRQYFCENECFDFSALGYRNCWDGLTDLDTVSRAAGLRGLILLIDEFEDVIHNMRNKAHQQSAFLNLFQFFSGDRFSNLAFFAVTPDFVQKCKQVLLSKGVWDYDYSRFDALKAFEMSPLLENQLLELGKRIVPVHFTAYDWSVTDGIVNRRLQETCGKGMRIPVQDRVRQTIRSIVKMLDEMMEEANA